MPERAKWVLGSVIAAVLCLLLHHCLHAYAGQFYFGMGSTTRFLISAVAGACSCSCECVFACVCVCVCVCL